MRTKTYFASSVPAALDAARRELGDNALLVSSKPTPPNARQYGRLEVTFAWDPEEPALRQVAQKGERKAERRPVEAGEAARQPIPAQRTATPVSVPPTAAGSEMDEIRRQLSALTVAVGQSGQLSGAPLANTPGFESTLMVERIVEAGFSRESAAELAAAAARRSGKPETAVVHELASRIPAAPFVEMKSGESRTLAFVGPPGRGKTTSLVKIAVTLGLARRVPVRIYSAGSQGVGAQEQMARFAAILGTPYQSCESLASLTLALNGEGWKGLALIDTPGISPADRDELSDLMSFLGGRPEIETHLVLRADASFADMLHMISRFSGLKPSRLLFTGMDEAIGVAPVIEALMRAGIPATFAGTGQQIPEDLEEVGAERLARAVWASPAAGTPIGVTRAMVRHAAA